MPEPLPYLERFEDDPELLDLILDTNERISRLVRYGVRDVVLASKPAWKIVWSNGGEKWNLTPVRPIRRDRMIQEVMERFSEPYVEVKEAQVGETIKVDANELIVYAPERSIDAILPYLNWLPLYGYSTEARESGIGEAPPPWTMHWTWTDPEGGPPLDFKRRTAPFEPPPGLPPMPHELLAELLRKMGFGQNPFENGNGPDVMPFRNDEPSDAMKAYAKKVLEESRRRRKERRARGETRSVKIDVHTGEELFWDRENEEWVRE